MLARKIDRNSGSVRSDNERPAKKQSRNKRGKVIDLATRLENTPAPPLALASLPTIPASIPHTLVFNTADQKVAVTALALLDLGIMSSEDTEEVTLSNVISSTLDRWMKKYTSSMTCLKPLLTITDDIENLNFSSYDVSEGIDNNRITAEEMELVLALEFDEAFRGGWMCEKVELLEAVKTGLGETALAVLYRSLNRVGSPFTPEIALEAARYHYWQGEDDETEIRADYESNDEEWDEDEHVTRAEFDKAMPRWVSEPKNVLFCEDIIPLIHHANQQVSSTAKAILDVLDRDANKNTVIFAESFLGDGGSVVYPPIALQWKKGDLLMERIFDDHQSFCYETSCSSYSTLHFCSNDPEGICKVMSELNTHMSRMVAADRLTSLLTDF